MASTKSPGRRKAPPSKPDASGRGKNLRGEGDTTNLVVMGRIVGAFGLQGWVKVKPFTQEPGGLAEFARWIIAAPEGWREVAVQEFELHSKGPVAKLAGCDDREGAEKLRNRDVAVRREALGEAEDGTLYWVDLVGLDVVNEQGERLGKIEGLFETGETGVLVVGGERQRMIPFVAEYVKSVDRVAGRVLVDWKADYDA